MPKLRMFLLMVLTIFCALSVCPAQADGSVPKQPTVFSSNGGSASSGQGACDLVCVAGAGFCPMTYIQSISRCRNTLNQDSFYVTPLNYQCPAHSSGSTDCVCDSGYKPDSAGKQCVPGCPSGTTINGILLATQSPATICATVEGKQCEATVIDASDGNITINQTGSIPIGTQIWVGSWSTTGNDCSNSINIESGTSAVANASTAGCLTPSTACTWEVAEGVNAAEASYPSAITVQITAANNAAAQAATNAAQAAALLPGATIESVKAAAVAAATASLTQTTAAIPDAAATAAGQVAYDAARVAAIRDGADQAEAAAAGVQARALVEINARQAAWNAIYGNPNTGTTIGSPIGQSIGSGSGLPTGTGPGGGVPGGGSSVPPTDPPTESGGSGSSVPSTLLFLEAGIPPASEGLVDISTESPEFTFDRIDFAQESGCPEPIHFSISVPFFSRQFDIPFNEFCIVALTMRPLFLALASITAIMIFMAGMVI